MCANLSVPGELCRSCISCTFLRLCDAPTDVDLIGKLNWIESCDT